MEKARELFELFYQRNFSFLCDKYIYYKRISCVSVLNRVFRYLESWESIQTLELIKRFNNNKLFSCSPNVRVLKNSIKHANK